MRSPWIDLLFLHHHVTPAKLAWRADASSGDCRQERVEVDVNQLPLQTAVRHPSRCCA